VARASLDHLTKGAHQMPTRSKVVTKVRCSRCGNPYWESETVANGEGPCFCPDCDEMPDTHEPDYGGVLGADGQVHSDADPGL